ncbi:MAG: sugar phosphate nucleotidyltransferase [Candidatus Bathyarchaeota archaeon]|nr:sugar phosphate nucleotidyltransferase [Candidatus Bathyarchaeota archaeon]
MKAVILAAGEGTRLKPITTNRPKPLIKIGGKPILEHTLLTLSDFGVNEVIIVTNYKEKAIQQYFGDGTKYNLKINYKKQEKMNGTGDALSTTESIIKDNFILIYGDLLFSPEAIKKIVHVFKTKKIDGAIAVTPIKNPEKYGIVEIEKDQKIKRIIEKPDINEAPSNLANAGLYVFSKEIFNKIKQIKASIRGEYELTDAISLFSQDGNQVLAVQIDKEDWIDIGRPWDLLEANKWILKKLSQKVCGTVEEGVHLIGSVTVAKTARIRSGAYIEGPAFIDEGSDIGPNCYIRPYTSIGKNVRIGNACEIKNTIIMDKTHVGHLSYVGDSIICERCNLGAGTIIANYRFDSKSVKMKVKNKLIDSYRRKLGAVLGDDVKTGIHAILLPGVKVGNNSWIGVNYILDRDLPANTYAIQNQNREKYKKPII